MNVLETLRRQRDALTQQLDGLLGVALPEDRTAAQEANTQIQGLLEQREQIDERIRQVEAEESRRAGEAAAAARIGAGAQVDPEGRAYVISEPQTYDPAARHSYFLDQARAQLNYGDGDGGVEEARQRLARHAQELGVELPARQGRRDQLARQASDREFRRQGVPSSARANMFETRTNPNRTDGQGGNFVPPLWLVDEYVDLPRFGRTTAGLCRQLELPSGTDSINLPKVATGTAVAIQTADGAAVQKTDLTDTFVNAPVRTIAGQQDIAIQLLDQSPVSFDEIVFTDLLADYNAKLDVQVITGTGAAGQVTGILNTGGINAITYTDASPTLPELWVPLLQSASKVAGGRKLPATAVVMTPAQWYWSMSQLDTTNRPLIVPPTVTVAAAGQVTEPVADGLAGMFTYGLPAYIDGNIPANLGAGTNESRMITARWQDLYLWEGAMRSRVLQEVLSNTLEVRLQLYNYVAFMANRRPESIAVVSGTGLIAPTGF